MSDADQPVRSLLRHLPAGCTGLIAGTAAQLFQDALWTQPAYAAWMLAGLALLLTARHWPLRASGVLLSLAFAALGLGLAGWRAVGIDSQGLDPRLEGRDLLLTGVVVAMPTVNEAGTRFVFQVERAQLEGRDVELPSRVLLGWYRGSIGWSGQGEAASLVRQPSPLAAGERWQLLSRLKAGHGHRNPHGFDYELWLWEHRIRATGYVRATPSDPAPQRLETTWRHPVEGLRQQVRDRIFEQLADPRWAGIVAALAVGDQASIERADWDVFRATGVAHLMSISGLHITMFAWVAAGLIGWIWRRSAGLCQIWPAQQAGLAGGLLLATAYAVFSGWGVPAQRTVFMLALVGLLRLSARDWPWPVVWLSAAALVVLADPWALLQAGFWLSFFAVGLLLASSEAPPADEMRASSAWTAIRRLTREQWVVTLGLAPLTLLLFHQVSLVGLLANLPAIPWVTLVVTPLSLLGVLWAPAWELAGWAIQGLALGLGWLASVPAATVTLPQAPLWAGVCALAGGALLALRLPWFLRAAAIPLWVPLLLWPQSRPAAGQFELLVADVGQGNAVLVRTSGHTLLYDAGPRYSRESDAGHRVLVPLLRALGERLDRVVVSHRDSDHAGGAAAVLGMQRDADFVSSIGADHVLAGLRAVRPCLAGQRWIWDGVVFEFLHPTMADLASRQPPNALSCVLRIQALGHGGEAGAAALLTGDIERAQEQRLVAAGAPLKADFLLVPHHGSRTSSSAEWLDAVAPSLAFVQAGYRNRFGHPAPLVVARYRERGIPLLSTPHCGALTWRSASPALVQCERASDRRYWQHQPG